MGQANSTQTQEQEKEKASTLYSLSAEGELKPISESDVARWYVYLPETNTKRKYIINELQLSEAIVYSKTKEKIRNWYLSRSMSSIAMIVLRVLIKNLVGASIPDLIKYLDGVRLVSEIKMDEVKKLAGPSQHLPALTKYINEFALFEKNGTTEAMFKDIPIAVRGAYSGGAYDVHGAAESSSTPDYLSVAKPWVTALAKGKEQLVGNIFMALKNLGYKWISEILDSTTLSPTAKARALADAVAQRRTAGDEVLICKKIAAEINKVFGNVIDEAAAPQICAKQINELFRSLSHDCGMDVVLLGVDIANYVDNLAHLVTAIKIWRQSVLERDSEIITRDKLAPLDAIIAEFERYIGMMQATINKEFSPTIIEAMRRDDVRPGFRMDDRIMSILMNMTGTAAKASVIAAALKKIGMTFEEYRALPSEKAIAAITEKAHESNADIADSRKVMDVIGVLANALGLRESLAPEIGKIMGRGVDGGLATPDRIVLSALQANRERAKLLVNSYGQAFLGQLRRIREAADAIASGVGTEIPIGQPLENFRDLMGQLAAIEMEIPKVHLELLGYYRDAAAQERRDRILGILRRVSDYIGTILQDAQYKSCAARFQAMKTAIDEMVATIDRAFDKLRAIIGGADGAEMSGTDDEIVMGSAEESGKSGGFGGSPFKVEIRTLITRDRLRLVDSIEKIDYLISVAQIKDNLKGMSVTFQRDIAKYDENVLGPVVAARIAELRRGQQYVIQQMYRDPKVQVSDGEFGQDAQFGDDTKTPAVIVGTPSGDAAKLEAHRAIARKFVDEYYDSIVGFWESAQAIEMYLKYFTKELITRVEDVQDISLMIREVTVLSKTYDDNSGHSLAELFELNFFNTKGQPPATNISMENPLTTPGGNPFLGLAASSLDSILKSTTSAVERYAALKMLISFFVHFGSKIGGEELRKITPRTPTEIYNGLVRYLSASAHAFGFGHAAKSVLVYDNKTGVLTRGTSSSGNIGADITSIIMRHANVDPALFDSKTHLDLEVENYYFASIIKALAAKILILTGMHDLVNRPHEMPYSHAPIRAIIGGSPIRVPKIETGATELYVRLPLLALFYKREFDIFGSGQSTIPEARKSGIVLLPDLMGSVFSELIRMIFRTFPHLDMQFFTNNEMMLLVNEINKIYAQYAAKNPADIARVIARDFVNAMSSMVYVLGDDSSSDYKRLLDVEVSKKQLREDDESDRDISILGDTGEESLIKQPLPSDQARVFAAPSQTSAIPPDASKQSAINTKLMKIIQIFRAKLDSCLSKSSQGSLRNGIADVRMRLELTTDPNERFAIVCGLVRGQSGDTEIDSMRKMIFVEVLGTSLGMLSGIYTLIRRLQVIATLSNADEMAEACKALQDGKITPDDIQGYVARDLLINANDIEKLPKVVFARDVSAKRSDGSQYQGNVVSIKKSTNDFETVITGIDTSSKNTTITGTHNIQFRDLWQYIVDANWAFRSLTESLMTLSEKANRFVRVEIEGTKIIADFEYLQEYVVRTLANLRSFIDVMRPHIDPRVVERYTNKLSCGSLYWLQEQFVEKLIEGRMTQSGQKYHTLSQLSHTIRRAYELMFMERTLSKATSEVVTSQAPTTPSTATTQSPSTTTTATAITPVQPQAAGTPQLIPDMPKTWDIDVDQMARDVVGDTKSSAATIDYKKKYGLQKNVDLHMAITSVEAEILRLKGAGDVDTKVNDALDAAVKNSKQEHDNMEKAKSDYNSKSPPDDSDYKTYVDTQISYLRKFLMECKSELGKLSTTALSKTSQKIITTLTALADTHGSWISSSPGSPFTVDFSESLSSMIAFDAEFTPKHRKAIVAGGSLDTLLVRRERRSSIDTRYLHSLDVTSEDKVYTDANGGILLFFNKLIAMYLHQTHDPSTHKFYAGLFNTFKGVFDSAIIRGRNVFPDHMPTYVIKTNEPAKVRMVDSTEARPRNVTEESDVKQMEKCYHFIQTVEQLTGSNMLGAVDGKLKFGTRVNTTTDGTPTAKESRIWYAMHMAWMSVNGRVDPKQFKLMDLAGKGPKVFTLKGLRAVREYGDALPQVVKDFFKNEDLDINAWAKSAILIPYLADYKPDDCEAEFDEPKLSKIFSDFANKKSFEKFDKLIKDYGSCGVKIRRECKKTLEKYPWLDALLAVMGLDTKIWSIGDNDEIYIVSQASSPAAADKSTDLPPAISTAVASQKDITPGDINRAINAYVDIMRMLTTARCVCMLHDGTFKASEIKSDTMLYVPAITDARHKFIKHLEANDEPLPTIVKQINSYEALEVLTAYMTYRTGAADSDEVSPFVASTERTVRAQGEVNYLISYDELPLYSVMTPLPLYHGTFITNPNGCNDTGAAERIAKYHAELYGLSKVPPPESFITPDSQQLKHVPDGEHVLFASLAHILNNITTTTEKQEHVYLYETSVDVPLNMRERYRAQLPFFAAAFQALAQKCDMYRRMLALIPKSDATGGNGFSDIGYGYSGNMHSKCEGILKAVSAGSWALVQDIARTLAEFKNQARYFEVSDEYISAYRAVHNADPIMPLSALLRVASRVDAEMHTELQPKYGYGEVNFKYQYAIRGLYNRPEKERDTPLQALAALDSMVAMFNKFSHSGIKLDQAKMQDIARDMIAGFDFLHHTCRVGWYTSRSETMRTAVVVDTALNASTNKAIVVLRTKPSDGKTAIPCAFGLVSDLQSIVNTVESTSRESAIKEIVTRTLKDAQPASTADIIISNIVDLNIVPFDIHVLSRQLPMHFVLNYAATFNSIVASMFDKDKDAIIKYSNPTDFKSTPEALINILINPHMTLTSAQKEVIDRLILGAVNIPGYERPRFLSDQLGEKVLFMNIWRSGEEAGPPATHMQNWKVSTTSGLEEDATPPPEKTHMISGQIDTKYALLHDARMDTILVRNILHIGLVLNIVQMRLHESLTSGGTNRRVAQGMEALNPGIYQFYGKQKLEEEAPAVSLARSHI